MHCIAYTGVRTEPRPNHELRVICGGGARVPSVAQGMMPSQRRSGGWAKVGAVSQPELARRQGETGGGRARVSSATMTARISLSSNAALPRTPGWEPHPHDSRCDAAMQRCRAPVNSTLGSRVRLKKILFFFFSFLFFFCHLHLGGPGSRGWETKGQRKNRQNKLRDQAVLLFGGLGELSSVTNAGKKTFLFSPSGADFRAELHPRPRRAVEPKSVAESPTERAF